MSDPRKPEIVVSMRIGDVRHKLELFSSYQFPRIEESPRHDEEDVPTVRVRHNGVWLPPGERQLMTLQDVMDMIRKVAANHMEKTANE